MESMADLKFEIGYVFIDIVGYSKLRIDEQKEWLRRLADAVTRDGAGARGDN